MYSPETRHEHVTWLSPNKLEAQKVQLQKFQVKTMLTAFFILNISSVTNMPGK
jgi:hypothetical protein